MDKTETKEFAGQWQWVQQFSIWEYDCKQWSLFVEPVDGEKWAAMVYLGIGSMSPVRQRDGLESAQKAKCWAVTALHEVAHAMLGVKAPNVYEVTATDEVHTFGAPFE